MKSKKITFEVILMKIGQRKEVPTGLKTSLSVMAGTILVAGMQAEKSELDWDTELARTLISYESQNLKDLAVLQLEKMIKVYPKQQDLINLLMAESYHLQNQNNRFDQTISKISKKSPIYGDAILLRSQRSLKRGKSDDAITLFAEYLTLFPNAPKEELAKEKWGTFVDLYSSVLSRTGQTEKAMEIKILKKQVAISKFEIRKNAFEIAKIELDALENASDVKDPVLSLNGKNAYMLVPGVKLPSKYTYEGLYFQEANDNRHLVVAAKAGTKNEFFVTLGTFGSGGANKSNKFVATHSKNPKKKDHSIKGNNYNDGQWHHFAVSFDGNALKLYRDGKLISEKPDKIASFGEQKTDFYFGFNCGKGYYKGQLDNLRLWNRALSSEELAINMFESVKTGKGLIFSYSFDGKKADDKKAKLTSPAWNEKSVRALNILTNIQVLKQNTFQSDYISAASQVEMARGYWLLGDYKNSVTIVRQGAELMLNLEKSMRKSRQNINYSPLAGAFYYYGMCYKSIADEAKQSGDTKKINKAYAGAIKKFAFVVSKYPESPYTPKCRIILSEIKDIVTALGWTEEQLVELNDASGSGAEAGQEEGDALFRSGDYAKAIESYRKSLTASMSGNSVKNILYYMTQSFVKNPARKISNSGQCWEAEAAADYLLTAYPTADEAVKVCLTMGGMYGAELKKEGLSDEQKIKLTDSTLRWFGEFINMRPKDEMAPVLKYKIAENRRGKTLDVIKEMNKEKGNVEKVEELQIKLTRELYKLVPQYLDIVEKYETTPQAVKSRFWLGLVYSQLQEFDQSAASYLEYVKTETDSSSKAIDQIHGASLSAGLQLMKAGKPEAAVKQYQATVDMIKASGKKDVKNSQLIESSYSLMAVANDMTGDKAGREVADLQKAGRDQRTLIRNSEHLIRKVEKTIVELSVAKAEVDKEFKEILESLDSGNGAVVDAKILAKDTEDVKKFKIKQAKIVKAKVLLAERSNLGKEVVGEKIQLKTDLENAKTELQRSSDEFNKNSVVKSRSARSIKETEALIRVIDIRIAGVKKDKERAVKSVTIEQEALAKLQKELELTRDLMQSPLQAERDKAQVRQVELLDQLRPAKQAEKSAVDKLQDAVLAEQVDIKQYNLNKTEAQIKLIDLKDKFKTSLRNEELLTKKKALYEVKIKAFEAGFVKNELQTKMLKSKDASSFDKKIADAVASYKTLLTAANVKATENYELENKFYSQDIADANAQIVSAKVKITELVKAEIPFQATYNKYKMEAVKYFDQFLEIYPKSDKYGARNLAKAGTIYIDFEQFEKAAIYLNRLKKDYPNDALVKSTTFDLADAYVKISRYAEAVSIYETVLKAPTDYSPAKMAGLQKRLLQTFEEKGDVAVSLLDVSAKAGKALHAKIMAKKSDKQLYSQRELCLFRIAEAYFLQKKYDDALKYYESLLSVNKQTGYLFEVKYKQGIAFRDKKNPELDMASRCFNEVTRFGDKAGRVMTYKAMMESAVASAANENYAGLKEACAGLELVIAGFDAENQEMTPIFERSYNMFTKYLALIGETEKAKKFVAEYKKNMPEGKYVRTISKLPIKKYSAPVAPVKETK